MAGYVDDILTILTAHTERILRDERQTRKYKVRGARFVQIVALTRAAAAVPAARVASYSIRIRGPRQRRTLVEPFERDTVVLHYSVTTRPCKLSPRRQQTRHAMAKHF